jgi:polyisoprenoid-binding protein YceI
MTGGAGRATVRAGNERQEEARMNSSTSATTTPQAALLLGLPAGLWVVDAEASTVGFAIRHLAATVHGRFGEFEGSVEIDGGGRAGGRVAVASLDTGMAARDRHLLAADCFDAERHPRIGFDGELVAIVPEVEVRGDLTIMGRTRPLALTGAIPDLEADRVRLDLRGVVRRREVGLQWGALFHAGLPIVADAVSIRLDVTLQRRP